MSLKVLTTHRGGLRPPPFWCHCIVKDSKEMVFEQSPVWPAAILRIFPHSFLVLVAGPFGEAPKHSFRYFYESPPEKALGPLFKYFCDIALYGDEPNVTRG